METYSESNQGHPRRWIIVATTFFTLALLYGAWYSYSVFLVAFLREFGWSRSVIAGAFSVLVTLHGSLGPMTGWVAGRVGPRRLIMGGSCILGLGLFLVAETTQWWHLYLTFGGIVAIGISMAGWIPSVLLIRGWFPGRVGTAIGIASAGIGVGISGVVPLSQFLIDSYGWRWAYRILAAIIILWVVPATFYLIRDPVSSDTSAPHSGATRGRVVSGADVFWTLSVALRDWHFWGSAGAFLTGNLVTQMLLVHQVAYLVDHGMPALAAATVGGAVGLASIVGKVGWGALSDRAGRELAYGLAFLCVVASLGVLVLAGARPASAMPYLYAALIGLGYGVMAPVPAAVTGDLFGGPGYSLIFGSLYTALCLGGAAGSWVAGEIFDRTGTYAMALWMGLAMAILSPTLLWMVAPRRPHHPPASV